jgi:hypothetical protein
LFVSLPALGRLDKDLVPEQLKWLDFLEEPIMELKQRRQFVVICDDDYDESQQTPNLHTIQSISSIKQEDVTSI